MYWIDENASYGTNQKQYFADGETDLLNLPKVQQGAGIGSKCLVIETGDVYILGSGNTWDKIGG